MLEGGIHYLNSGDWVESLTAIIEPVPGEFELVEFKSFMERRESGETLRAHEEDFLEIDSVEESPQHVAA